MDLWYLWTINSKRWDSCQLQLRLSYSIDATKLVTIETFLIGCLWILTCSDMKLNLWYYELYPWWIARGHPTAAARYQKSTDECRFTSEDTTGIMVSLIFSIKARFVLNFTRLRQYGLTICHLSLGASLTNRWWTLYDKSRRSYWQFNDLPRNGFSTALIVRFLWH